MMCAPYFMLAYGFITSSHNDDMLSTTIPSLIVVSTMHDTTTDVIPSSMNYSPSQTHSTTSRSTLILLISLIPILPSIFII